MKQKTHAASAKAVALGGVLTALSLVLLYLASVSPTGRLGLTAVAGVVPAAAVVSGGLGAGVLSYLAAGLLGLLLIPAKAAAILYLLFFGIW